MSRIQKKINELADEIEDNTEVSAEDKEETYLNQRLNNLETKVLANKKKFSPEKLEKIKNHIAELRNEVKERRKSV